MEEKRTINIPEEEYKELLKFKVQTEEQEKIIQMRIDMAVKDAIKNYHSKELYRYEDDLKNKEKIIQILTEKSLSSGGACQFTYYNNIIYSNSMKTDKYYFLTKDNTVIDMFKYYGFNLNYNKEKEGHELCIEHVLEGSSYLRGNNNILRYIELNNKKYYNIDFIDNIEEEIIKLNKERINLIDKIKEIPKQFYQQEKVEEMVDDKINLTIKGAKKDIYDENLQKNRLKDYISSIFYKK